MIYEYAIEPKLAVEWAKDRSEFRIAYKKFGLGKQRIMSEFPSLKNWRKHFGRATTGASDSELERITAIFSILTEKMVQRNSSGYDGTKIWLENAEIENDRHEFQAILALDNPRVHNNVLKSLPLDIIPNAKWDVGRTSTPERNATEMAKAVSAMLRNCKTAIFVDPYFRANRFECREPIKAFLKECVSSFNSPQQLRVEIHASANYDNAPSTQQYHQECGHAIMTTCIPNGMRVTFKRWTKRIGGEKLHNRYILTDLGGVEFGIGLDQGESGETDDVTLMERAQYELRWNQYVSENPAFDLAEQPLTIIGSTS